jgi:hypothetical protein
MKLVKCRAINQTPQPSVSTLKHFDNICQMKKSRQESVAQFGGRRKNRCLPFSVDDGWSLPDKKP